MKNKSIPGTIYFNQKRCWWRVILPGSDKLQRIALKPKGAKYATADPGVALEVAKTIYAQELSKTQTRGGLSGYDGTIAALYRLFMVHAKTYYRRANGTQTHEYENIELSLGPLADRYGEEMADDFGPGKLKEYRQSMIDGKQRKRPLCRSTINQRIGIVRRMFRWGASEELVSSHVIHGLEAVDGLKYGRSDAAESAQVVPIAVGHVVTTLSYASPVVRAMILTHLYTGCRTGELVAMKPCEIDTTGEMWLYKPTWHKTKHFGHERIITIGPKAQEAIKPYLKNNLKECCFITKEGNPFTRQTYADAIRRAIKAAARAGVTIPAWSPNQLRHTAATLIRKQFGLDAAAAVLGHSQVSTTEIYAEIDMALAAKAAKAIG